MLFCLLIIIFSIQIADKSQTGEEDPIMVRGDKDWRVSKGDSLLLKTLELGIRSIDMAIINKISLILDDCDVSMHTKEEIAKLLFIKGEKNDTALFKVNGESLF